MMLSSGIPGLSIEDLRYLRTSLALDMTEDEVLGGREEKEKGKRVRGENRGK